MHKLPPNDWECVKSLIESDIIETGLDMSFFDKMKLDPKDYIDQMTAIGRMFGLDFWQVIDRHCSDSELQRLHGLYDGIPISKLVACN